MSKQKRSKIAKSFWNSLTQKQRSEIGRKAARARAKNKVKLKAVKEVKPRVDILNNPELFAELNKILSKMLAA